MNFKKSVFLIAVFILFSLFSFSANIQKRLPTNKESNNNETNSGKNLKSSSLKIPTWVKTYGKIYDEVSKCVYKTSDGGYILTGYTYMETGSYDFLIIKLDSNGDIVWSKTIGGSAIDTAESIIQTSDGGYAVIGSTYSFGAGGEDFLIIKLDSNGNISWSKTYGFRSDECPFSIIQTSDGGYLLAGYTNSLGAGGYDFLVIKTDSNGTLSWAKTYGGSGWDIAKSIVHSPDGGYTVFGSTTSYGSGYQDFLLIKLTDTGEITWARTYGGTNDDDPCCLLKTSFDTYAMLGTTFSFGTGESDIFLVKVDNEGSVYSANTYGWSGYEKVHSITNTPDGGLAIVGETNSLGLGDQNMFILKTTSTGYISWCKLFEGITITLGQSIVQSSDGGYAALGTTSSFGAGTLDFLLLKLDQNGTTSECTPLTLCNPNKSEIFLFDFSCNPSTRSWTTDLKTQYLSAVSQSITTNVICPETADLTITAIGTPTPVIAGNTITYKITVTNNGPSNATSVIATSEMSSELENVYFSIDGGGSWNPWNGSLRLGNILNKYTSTFLIKGTVKSSADETIMCTFSVSSDTPDPDNSNNSFSVNTDINTRADLTITKKVNSNTIVMGNEITFTITTHNNGPSDAQNVIVSDTISSYIETPLYSTDNGNTWSAWTGNLNIGTLPPDEETVILISGTVSANTPNFTHIQNKATVSSDTEDPDIANNDSANTEGVTDTVIRSGIDLFVSKQVNTDESYPGNELIYTINITNLGTNTAENVVLSDNVPILTNLIFSTDGGTTWNTWEGSTVLPQVTGNSAITILIKGLIPDDFEGTITNEATVNTTNLPDENLDNNDTANTSGLTNATTGIHCSEYKIHVEVINGTGSGNFLVCNPQKCNTVFFYGNEGYHLSQLYINGHPHSFGINQISYTFCGIEGDQTVKAVFVQNQNPVITDFQTSPEYQLEGKDIKFICTGYDPDGGEITKYYWDFNGDGIEDYQTSENTFTKSFTYPGRYSVAVKIKDDEGETSDWYYKEIRVVRKNKIIVDLNKIAEVFGCNVNNINLHLINLNKEEKDIYILDNETGRSTFLSIPGNGKRILSYPDLENGEKTIYSDGVILYYLEIQSDTILVGEWLGNYINETLWASHIAEETQLWKTYCILMNEQNNDLILNYGNNEIFLGNNELTVDELSKYYQNNSNKYTNLNWWGRIAGKNINPFEETRIKGLLCYKQNNADSTLVPMTFKSLKKGYIAHIPTETGFWSGFVLVNTAENQGKYLLKFYSENGELLTTKEVTLNGKEKYKCLIERDFAQYFGQVAWIKIEGEEGEFIGESLYGKKPAINSGGGVCGFEIVENGSKELIFPFGVEDGLWSGLSIVNIESDDCTIDLKIYNENGEVIKEHIYPLKGLSQLKIVLNDITKTIENVSYIKITSTNEIIGCEIKGNNKDTALEGAVGLGW